MKHTCVAEARATCRPADVTPAMTAETDRGSEPTCSPPVCPAAGCGLMPGAAATTP